MMFSRPSVRVAYFLGGLAVFALVMHVLPGRLQHLGDGDWAGDLVFGGLLLTFLAPLGPSPGRSYWLWMPAWLGIFTAIDVGCHRAAISFWWEIAAQAALAALLGIIVIGRQRRLGTFVAPPPLSSRQRHWRGVLLSLATITVIASIVLVRSHPAFTLLATPVILLALVVPLVALGR